jgi:superfamily II DNA/RNA helicase
VEAAGLQQLRHWRCAGHHGQAPARPARPSPRRGRRQPAEQLDEDYESLDEIEDEWIEADPAARCAWCAQSAPWPRNCRAARLQALATTIRDNAKGKALLTALGKAFAELERLGAAKKAIIFTESRRTQDYLLGLLEQSAYATAIRALQRHQQQRQATQHLQAWLKRHAGTDRITGSRTADTRAALVEHFKERGQVMIATEAGAEGINLQFCSLVINYDLPWNPQRIEQRIGRCHRYGQKHDVVVVNFVDHSNPADKRVYELLAQKFQLFEGVFGASDEVLGTIGSGVDFERRIAEIYQTCRNPQRSRLSSSNCSSTCPARSAPPWSRPGRCCWRTLTKKCRTS